jgi:DnaJ-class molecular chaperone
MKRINFVQIDEARKLLGLDQEASLEDIRKAFHTLSLKYHPDRCREQDKQSCEERFKQIVEAKDLLLKYCAGYRFSFKEEDVKKNSMDKHVYDHFKQFYEDWL